MIKEIISTIKELLSYTKNKLYLQKIGLFTVYAAIAGIITYNGLPFITKAVAENKKDIAFEIQTSVINKQNTINCNLMNKLDSVLFRLNELDANIKRTQAQQNNLTIVTKDLILKLNLSTVKTIELYEKLNNYEAMNTATQQQQKNYNIKFKR